MNFIHSANSSKAGRRRYRHPSRSSTLQELCHFGLGLALATGSFLFAEPLSAATPLAWGAGYVGQLGDGNFYSTGHLGVAIAVQVSALTGITGIAGGDVHSLALRSDGTVWAWGTGFYGELGDGNFYGSPGVATPVQVSGLTTVTTIACGSDHSLALKSDGTVWAWGLGVNGQLGDGNFYTSPINGSATPVQVIGLTAVTAIGCGGQHSLAVKSDGTVWAWGAGTSGQLGNDNFYTLLGPGAATPVQVRGLRGVVAIAGGGYHSLALKSDGTVWAWGGGFAGQLGDGNFYTTAHGGLATPVQVRGLNGVVAIAGRGEHSLALKSDGTVWAWGDGFFGEVGDGNFSSVATPVQVSSLSAVVGIACGLHHNLALKVDGSVWAWGFGRYGQLGDGNFYETGRDGVGTPVLASSLGQPVSVIAAGGDHSLALPAVAANRPVITCPSDVNLSNGPGQCSAVGNYPAPLVSGGVGNVVVVCNPTSGSVFPIGTTTVTCTATDAAGNIATCSFNVTVSAEPLPATPVAWGAGNTGQLGNGVVPFPNGVATPVHVIGLTSVTALAGGAAHSLALSDGTVWSWGRGSNGQLGDGNFRLFPFEGVATPVQVSGLTAVMAIASGENQALALKFDGTVWAWGRGQWGQLGDGNFYTTGNEGIATPIQVSALANVAAIAGGGNHSLALESSGVVWAWGFGHFGQLGDGNFWPGTDYTVGNAGVAAPVQVPALTSVTAITGGGNHSLALKSVGTVWAWGFGRYGQLGDGNFYTTGNQGVATPVQVSGLTGVTAIAGGGAHSLALKSDGTVWAWGWGHLGQLGDGNVYNTGNQGVAAPVQVSGLSGVVAIACGEAHSLALKSDGTVWAWGSGQWGQLGDGSFQTVGPLPVQVTGLTTVTAIACGGQHCLALPAVAANTPPVITCPSDVNVSNDPGQCSAIVNYPAPLVRGGACNVVVVCNPPSGSVFPIGTTTVTCTATDDTGSIATCSFNVAVSDTEPPAASCAVVKAPVLLSNPPRIVGSFQLLATDNCDPDPLIYIKGSAGSFVAGPFHNGDQVEIAHGPRLIPRQAPTTSGANIASIQLNGDALLWAVDSSGNASTPIKCK